MAATVFCNGVPSGLTLTASIFPDGSDTAAQTGLACTEATNRKTTYSFPNTGDQTGLHLIQLLSGSNVVWVGWAVLAAAGTIQAEDTRQQAELQTAMALSAGAYRFTAAALALGPSGGGGAVSFSVPAATARAVLAGDTIGVTRGDTLRVTITGLGNIATRQKLWFTVKRSKNVADAAALIQIEETAGLTLLNGAATTAAWGTLTVTDATAGDVSIVLYAAATKDLAALTGAVWDIQELLGSSPADVVTLTEGKLNVEADVTLATS